MASLTILIVVMVNVLVNSWEKRVVLSLVVAGPSSPSLETPLPHARTRTTTIC